MDLTNYKKEIIQLEKELKNIRLLSNKKQIIPKLSSLLIKSIDKRTKTKVGIAFSGGVDSTLITLICKKLKKDFILYNVGLKNSKDAEWAKRISKYYKWKLKQIIVDEKEAEEIAKEEMEGLSQEGREMVKALKNIKEKKTEAQEKDSERDNGKEQKKRYEILEETVAKERKTFSQETAGMQYGLSPESRESRFGTAVAYGVQSTKPLGELYQEASALRKSIEEKGYVSQADERRAEYFTAAVQGRMQAVEEGTYSLSEQAARAASLTQMIGENIQQSYRGKRKNEWYS